jgi:hypothetical protein
VRCSSPLRRRSGHHPPPAVFFFTEFPSVGILGNLALSCVASLWCGGSFCYTGQACSASFLEEFFSETCGTAGSSFPLLAEWPGAP